MLIHLLSGDSEVPLGFKDLSLSSSLISAALDALVLEVTYLQAHFLLTL